MRVALSGDKRRPDGNLHDREALRAFSVIGDAILNHPDGRDPHDEIDKAANECYSSAAQTYINVYLKCYPQG